VRIISGGGKLQKLYLPSNIRTKQKGGETNLASFRVWCGLIMPNWHHITVGEKTWAWIDLGL
jgi:hypothetical protein